MDHKLAKVVDYWKLKELGSIFVCLKYYWRNIMSRNESNLFRITIKPDSKIGKAFDFCQEKSIVGVG